MKFRKNNKGFSLVELIIVIAIMVALIAVMAPQFTKYIQKSRDAAFDSSCEDFLSAVKSSVSDETDGIGVPDSEATLTLKVDNKVLTVTGTGLTDSEIAALCTAAGVTSSGTAMGQTARQAKITITTNGSVTMVKSSGAIA